MSSCELIGGPADGFVVDIPDGIQNIHVPVLRETGTIIHEDAIESLYDSVKNTYVYEVVAEPFGPGVYIVKAYFNPEKTH